MKLLDYSCFKPPQNEFPQTKSQFSWYPVFGESPQPTQRSRHAVCVFNNRIFMYGGRGNKGTLNQFWVLNCDNLRWSELKSTGNAPPRLEGHSMVVYQAKIYIFGGETSFASADESPLWCYDIEECAWSKINSDGTIMEPCGRRQHTAVLYMDVMCIYGGYQDLVGPTKEMWLFDFETKSWHFDVAASNESAPDGRYGHCAAVDRQSMWVCGGLTGLKPNSEVLVWNFELMNWITVKAKGGPPELSGHSMCMANDSLYIFGGCDSHGKSSSDMWRLPLAESVWKKCHYKDLKPPAITGHSLIVLHSPSLLKRDFRTRSFPNVKRKQIIKEESAEKQRSVSCGKLPNTSKLEYNSTDSLNLLTSNSDRAALVPPSDNKSDFAYDNPLMAGETSTPKVSGTPQIEIRTVKTNFTAQEPKSGGYVSSRLRYGNITDGGSSLKIFSYNLLDDALQENEAIGTLTETSFIDVSTSRICVSEVTNGISGHTSSRKNQFPVITQVKPYLVDDEKQWDVELESMNENDAPSVDHSNPTNKQPTMSQMSQSKKLSSRYQRDLTPDCEEQFVVLVMGGEASNVNPGSSKQFLLWQCNMLTDDC